MAKKSQTNARRNSTQAGRRVVNFYNSTIHIDARQNRSRTNKTENNGCTINYPCYSASNLVGDYFTSPDQSKSTPNTTSYPSANMPRNILISPIQLESTNNSNLLNYSASKIQEDRKSFSKKLKIAAGIFAATMVVGLSIAAIKYFK